MSFLSPLLLWGGLAAGIPIAIHFFFRARYRTVYWGAMQFLRQAIEQTSRRLRFQELLLLLLRIGILLLLAFALARPTTRTILGTVTSDAVDAVLVFDNSLSMDARDGKATRLERAKAAGRTVIRNLPPHSTVQIIVFSDRASLIGPRQYSDLEQAMTLIDGIEQSARGTDLAPALREANEALRRGSSPQRELYIWTDAQTLGFEQQPAAIAEAAKACQELATVYFCRCGHDVANNATLIGLSPRTGLPHIGERIGFSALIKNTGSEPMRDITVSLTPDNDANRRESQPLPRLDPGETRVVSLTARWSEPGPHTVTARLQPDDLATDDRCDLVLRVRDKVRVLVVDGAANDRDPEKASSFFLLHALLPVKDADKPKYHLQPRIVTPSRTSPQMLADQDLCILSNVAVERNTLRGEVLPAEFVSALDRFVREGKTLLVFAGDRVDPAAYAKAMLDRWPLLPLRPVAVRSFTEQTEVGIDRAGLTDPAFVKFRDDETYQTLGLIRTRKLIETAELPDQDGAGPSRVLMRASNGMPLLASRTVGAGLVAMMTTSPDTTWTDLPLWVNAYVPLIDALLAHVLLAESDAHNVNVRQGIQWNVPANQAETQFGLIRPDGQRLRIGRPAPFQGRPRIAASDTPLAGVYRLAPTDAPDSAAVPFAVRFDTDEAIRTERLPDDRINERFGFAPVHLQVTDDLSPFSGGERSKLDWTPRLLWILLAATLAETFLAFYVGRPR